MLAGLGLDENFARVTSGAATGLLTDGLGSTVAMSNSATTTTATYGYSPYGETVKSGTDSTPMEYTGRENDGATGLYYYRARYYSPALGRFISEDPIGMHGGLNLYAYVGSNPVQSLDPSGLTQADINELVELARITQPDLPVPEPGDIHVADLSKQYGEGVVGITSRYPWPLNDITIDSRYLKILAPEERVDLFDTIIHESVHRGQWWWIRDIPELGEPPAYAEAERRTKPWIALIKAMTLRFCQ